MAGGLADEQQGRAAVGRCVEWDRRGQALPYFFNFLFFKIKRICMICKIKIEVACNPRSLDLTTPCDAWWFSGLPGCGLWVV